MTVQIRVHVTSLNGVVSHPGRLWVHWNTEQDKAVTEYE